jgi:hypothetical protein
LDLCFVVVVVVVGDFAGDDEDDEELPLSPPQPARANVVARTAPSVRMAGSVVRFMGRAPAVTRGLRHSPYQPSAARFAVA